MREWTGGSLNSKDLKEEGSFLSDPEATKGRRHRRVWLGTAAAVALLTVGLGALLLFFGARPGGPFLGKPTGGGQASAATTQADDWPDFVYSSAGALEAYRLAKSYRTTMARVPCYCSCGRASKHRNLDDCFYKEDGTWNDHASACDVCQKEIVDIDRWAKEGAKLSTIRDRIDEKYAEYGSATDTPKPDVKDDAGSEER